MLLIIGWALWVGSLFALRFFRGDNIKKLAAGDLPRLTEIRIGQLTMSLMKERAQIQDEQLLALNARLTEVEDKQLEMASVVEVIRGEELSDGEGTLE